MHALDNTDPNVWINGHGDVRVECSRCGFVICEHQEFSIGTLYSSSSTTHPCRCTYEELQTELEEYA